MQISSIAATTHVDAHGERLTREALEELAQGIKEHQVLMFWNHEMTLPPIGLMNNAWVEPREDGEYQLRVEGYLFEQDDIEFVPQSKVQGLDLTWEDMKAATELAAPPKLEHLTIFYDPRNFDHKDVSPIIAEINQLITTKSGLRVRKAVLPPPVIWIIVGYAGGQIVSGFFSRLGEVLADEAVQAARQSYKDLATHIVHLLSKAKPESRRPDVVWEIPILGSETKVEGALEEAVEKDIVGALETLPRLYTLAESIIRSNAPNYFSIMGFLYNPEQKGWDINYLVIRRSNRVIKGPRYYVPNHPLRSRYEQMLSELPEQIDKPNSQSC